MVRLITSNRIVSFRFVALILQSINVHVQFTRRYNTYLVFMLVYMFLCFSVLLIRKAYCIGGCKVRVGGHCFTTTETTQTFTKVLTLGLNIIFLGLMLALVKVWVVSAVVKQ